MSDIDDVANSTAEAVRASAELLEFLSSVRDDVARAMAQSRSEIDRSRELLRLLHRGDQSNSQSDNK